MYTYPISDFPFGKWNLDRLTKEIFDSTIIIGLNYMTGNSENVTIYFKADLSVGEKATLDSIIAAHSGEPMPYSVEIQQVKIAVEQPKYIDSGNVTQELFCAESILIDVSAGTGLQIVDYSWPFNIALKSGTLYITEDMIGDEMSVKVAPNTIIGAITSNVKVGDTSIYVSPTVIQNIKYGQYVGFPTLNHELGRVVTVGSNYLTIKPAADVSVNAGTYVGMCAKIIPYVYFNSTGVIEIGKTVTTANRIPANTKVRVEYKNNTGVAKKISLFIEYLY
jgi:carbonic anhydrase/acetyltransferase-like protein (isoleucine patch superfamily)